MSTYLALNIESWFKKMKKKIIKVCILFSLAILSWAQGPVNEVGRSSNIKPAPDMAADQAVLPLIMKKTAEYCKRLEEFSIYYFCKEKVRETIYPIPKKYRKPNNSSLGLHGQFTKFHNKSSIVNNFIYEYQLIRKGKKEKERRLLLEENGKDKNRKKAKLKTRCFKYSAVVLYPLAFSENEQRYYNFKILGKEKWSSRNVFVIQVLPRPGIQKDLLWGKFWVDEKKFSILKIEVSPVSIGNYYKITHRAILLNSKPRITIQIDYNIEKNGIRFPGTFFIKEAYLTPQGRKILLSEILVNYQEYRFFSVGVDVKYKNF